MRRTLCITLGWMALMMWVASSVLAEGERRFPPPQFDKPHVMPTTTTPPADGAHWAYVDMVMLAGALSVGAWLVLRRRSRRGVFVWMVACLVYFGFYRQGCVCAIGSVQNVSLAMGDGGYALPWVVGVFFLLPIVFTLFFGRIFCAGVCPLGAIQDVMAWRPIHLPHWLEHGLGLGAYLYLGAAVLFAATGSAFIICEFDPFVAFFRMSGATTMLLLGAAFLITGIFIVRPYCRFICPYGVILGWLGPIARCQPRIDPVGCINCHLCKDSCPVNAIEYPPTAGGQGDDARVVATADRRRMAVLLVALPLLIVGGALLGGALSDRFARVHRQVALAERIAKEDANGKTHYSEASEAYRNTGEPVEALYASADGVRGRFAIGTPLLGAFMGLVIGVKLITLARRPIRTEYEIDQSRCVACARCFAYCPHDPTNAELLQQIELKTGGNVT